MSYLTKKLQGGSTTKDLRKSIICDTYAKDLRKDFLKSLQQPAVLHLHEFQYTVV